MDFALYFMASADKNDSSIYSLQRILYPSNSTPSLMGWPENLNKKKSDGANS